MAIINEGRIIADGSISDLSRDAMGSNRVYVAMKAEAAEVENALRGTEGVTEVTPVLGDQEGSRFEVRAGFDVDLTGKLVALAASRGWQLSELHESPFSLEDTFIALTRRARTDRGAA